MRLLILCAVLSAIIAVSLASPVKTQKHDVIDTSDSSESSESNNFEKNSSSSEGEEKQQEVVTKYKVKDNNQDNSSADTSEEEPDNNTIVKDEVKENHSVEVDVADRSKRAVNFASHVSNQLTVNDKASIKYKKNLKLKQLRRALESDESKDSEDISPRFARSADTSEESSSEEDQTGKNDGAHEHSTAEGVVIAKKPDAAPAETLELASKADTVAAESNPKPEGSRRRRNLGESSEEDQSVQERDVNEVFIFSNEKQDSEENFKSFHLKSMEYVVRNEKVLSKSELYMENKNSEDDYAQGCGGSNGNHDDDSNESNDENNETIIDKLR